MQNDAIRYFLPSFVTSFPPFLWSPFLFASSPCSPFPVPCSVSPFPSIAQSSLRHIQHPPPSHITLSHLPTYPSSNQQNKNRPTSQHTCPSPHRPLQHTPHTHTHPSTDSQSPPPRGVASQTKHNGQTTIVQPNEKPTEATHVKN